MNLNRFIDTYGCYSFDDVPFTEIDNIIFANLSYINLEGYVSKSRFHPKRLEDVGNSFFENLFLWLGNLKNTFELIHLKWVCFSDSKSNGIIRHR